MEAKKLGFGCMRLPQLEEKDPTKIDMEQFCKMIDLFLERGFTYFDTAYMYHNGVSETVLREALVRRHDRNSFTVTTKLPTMMLKHKEDNERIFQEQLEKVGVDYFDYYLLHCLNTANYAIAQKLDCFDFIVQKKAEGKIKKIGFSYHDKADLLDEILTAHPEVEFVQLQLNYLDWESDTIQSRKCYEVCEKHRKPVIVMEPIKGGMLAKIPEAAEKELKAYDAEASDSSWAIRFAASKPEVMMVLSGMSDLAQIEDNTEYMKEFQPLTEEESEIVKRVVDIINSSITISCTGCKYCISGCPQNIPISDYFTLYNTHKQFGAASSSQFHYRRLVEEGAGRASDCINCGKCKKACPQHLDIPEFMKEVSQLFDTPSEGGF